MGAQEAHKGMHILIKTIQRKEVKKAFRKQSHKHKKCRANNSESDSHSTAVCEAMDQIAQGNNVCKKCKLNVSVNDNTYPSLSKAIQHNKIELNHNFDLEMMQENISKNLEIIFFH